MKFVDSIQKPLKIDKKLTKPAWILSETLQAVVFVLVFGIIVGFALYYLAGIN